MAYKKSAENLSYVQKVIIDTQIPVKSNVDRKENRNEMMKYWISMLSMFTLIFHAKRQLMTIFYEVE